MGGRERRVLGVFSGRIHDALFSERTVRDIERA